MAPPLVCPACGTGGGMSERFCPRCGSPFVLAAGVEGRAAPRDDEDEITTLKTSSSERV